MLKIGVLGAGHLGKIHIRLLKESTHYELVGFYDTMKENAARVEEELGIKEGTCKLQEIDSFVYFQNYGDLSEYEFDHVIVGEYAGDIVPNPEEIQDYRWISYADLAKELMECPKKFSAWFLIAAPKVLRWLTKEV